MCLLHFIFAPNVNINPLLLYLRNKKCYRAEEGCSGFYFLYKKVRECLSGGCKLNGTIQIDNGC